MSEELNIAKEEAPENNIISLANKTTPEAAEDKTDPDETKEQAAAASETTVDKETAASKETSGAFAFDEDEPPKKHSFFRSRSHNNDYLRDKLILSRIKDEDLMEYLTLEQQRLEFLQQAKETKEKRIFTAFQLTVSLAAIVAVTYLLRDNPTILISILYTVGIVAALHIWKNPRDKDKNKK